MGSSASAPAVESARVVLGTGARIITADNYEVYANATIRSQQNLIVGVNHVLSDNYNNIAFGNNISFTPGVSNSIVLGRSNALVTRSNEFSLGDFLLYSSGKLALGGSQAITLFEQHSSGRPVTQITGSIYLTRGFGTVWGLQLSDSTPVTGADLVIRPVSGVSTGSLIAGNLKCDALQSTSLTCTDARISGGLQLDTLTVAGIQVSGPLSCDAFNCKSIMASGLSQLTGGAEVGNLNVSGVTQTSSLTCGGAVVAKSTLSVTGASTLSTLSCTGIASSQIATAQLTCDNQAAFGSMTVTGIRGGIVADIRGGKTVLQETACERLSTQSIDAQGDVTISGRCVAAQCVASSATVSGFCSVGAGMRVVGHWPDGTGQGLACDRLLVSQVATCAAGLTLSSTSDLLKVQGPSELSSVKCNSLDVAQDTSVGGATTLRGAVTINGAVTCSSTLGVAANIQASSIACESVSTSLLTGTSTAALATVTATQVSAGKLSVTGTSNFNSLTCTDVSASGVTTSQSMSINKSATCGYIATTGTGAPGGVVADLVGGSTHIESLKCHDLSNSADATIQGQLHVLSSASVDFGLTCQSVTCEREVTCTGLSNYGFTNVVAGMKVAGPWPSDRVPSHRSSMQGLLCDQLVVDGPAELNGSVAFASTAAFKYGLSVETGVAALGDVIATGVSVSGDVVCSTLNCSSCSLESATLTHRLSAQSIGTESCDARTMTCGDLTVSTRPAVADATGEVVAEECLGSVTAAALNCNSISTLGAVADGQVANLLGGTTETEALTCTSLTTNGKIVSKFGADIRGGNGASVDRLLIKPSQFYADTFKLPDATHGTVRCMYDGSDEPSPGSIVVATGLFSTASQSTSSPVTSVSMDQAVPMVQLSSETQATGIVGVFDGWEGAASRTFQFGSVTHEIARTGQADLRMVVAVSGFGQIIVNGENGTTLSVGDLICSSSSPGQGMLQASDSVHSFTVAKCMQNQEIDGAMLVACKFV